MSLVLAVDPDGEQTESLRQIVGRHDGAQLVLVRSAYAAVVAINRRVPDLVLVSESLGPKTQQSVVDHFRAVSATADPQTLVIPDRKARGRDTSPKKRKASGTGQWPVDDEHFGAQVAACLARVDEHKRAMAKRAAPVEPVHDPILDLLRTPPKPQPAPEAPDVRGAPGTRA